MAENRLDVHGLTDIGRKRKRNEDCFDLVWRGDTVWCVVADGMGGHAGGDVASRTAVDGAVADVRDSRATGATALRSAIERAHVDVWAIAEADPKLLGMGTTIVCAEITPSTCQVAHVGDSRAYLIHDGAIRQLTTDHSWVGEQVVAGKMTAEEAAKHPYRGAITRCLGCQPTVDPEIGDPVTLATGDAVVLCTDGLTGHLSDQEIVEIVLAHDAEEGGVKLVELANERGGQDNITVMVLKLRPAADQRA